MRFIDELAGAVKRLLSTPAALRLFEVIGRRMDNRMSEFGMIAQAFEFKHINQVEGDYFEFGLWRGKTFIHAHRMMRRFGFDDVTLRGFDSFEGLPAHERSSDGIWHEGQFACSKDEFRKLMKRNGVDEGCYELVEGFYSQSLNADLHDRLRDIKVAIAYIDCDLYESTRDVLKFLHGYLVNGTIVCFDDYYNNRGDPEQGEARALNEFLRSHPDIRFLPYFDYSPLGKSFIVRLDQADTVI